MTLHRRHSIALAAAAALLAACGGGGGNNLERPAAAQPNANANLNFKPAFIVGPVNTTEYDGTSDDLLTAGLGTAGLALAAAPPYANALAPTAAELRRTAIHTNYRALVDMTANGGYGRLYGPNVAIDGTVTGGSGKIAGTEVIAYADDGSGRDNVTLMVQVPSTFDPKAPCIVSATSSGSRGVYGAIATSGEWGLKHGCAVAYTDKGSGLGVHDLQAHTVNRIDGTRGDAAAVGSASNFTAALSDAERSAFNAATPNRFAVKHAHSQRNPEKDWGKHTLQAIEFAFWVLNERYGTTTGTGYKVAQIRPHNTLVIASSVSNGAGAALAAAEQDEGGWIDGVAVSEPNIQLPPGGDLRIERGARPAYTAGSKALYDYFTLGNLLQPCAALASSVAATSPFGYAGATAFVAGNRCAALASAGLVSGATTAERADNALAQLRAYGWEPDSDLLHASHYLFASPAIAVTYANTYGRFSVADNRCGFSFGAVDAAGSPMAAPAAAIAGVFASGNGVPPSGALQLVYNPSVGGAKSHGAAVSPSTGQFDFAFDGAHCLRQLWTGASAEADRVRAGVAEVYRGANLRGKPTLVVHGRADALIPVNFNSRPYVLRNRQVEGAASQLRYVEVTNGQHFDAFLGFPGYDTRYVPLHVYFNRALDAMWAHLKSGTALPPSQVVRTTPRGGTPGLAPAITESQLPPIAAVPAAGDAITFGGGALRVPD